MAKITISDLTASFASTTALNAKFQQIEDEFNNKVVYRDESGSMTVDLDLGGNQLLNAVLAGTTTIPASNVTVTPTGDVASTNAQAAIAELDSEKAKLAGDSTQAFDTANLGVTGNISVTGTVDGRDVAADGTKLDTVQAGATDDQTPAEILAALLTVDGPTSGLDADTIDGAHLSNLAYNGNDTIFGNYIFQNITPYTQWYETSVATDQGRWDISIDGETLNHRIIDDAQANTFNWMTVERSGTGAGIKTDSIDFIADTMSYTLASGLVNLPYHKRDATTAPSSTDDSTAGYSIGSEWIDVTNDDVYICVDATASAAQWIQAGTSTPGGVTSLATSLGGLAIGGTASVPSIDHSGTLGTVAASSIVTADASLNISGINALQSTNTITIEATTPWLRFSETDGTLNNKNWAWITGGEVCYFRTYDDSWTGPVDIMSVARTGTTVDLITLYGLTNVTGGCIVNGSLQADTLIPVTTNGNLGLYGNGTGEIDAHDNINFDVSSVTGQIKFNGTVDTYLWGNDSGQCGIHDATNSRPAIRYTASSNLLETAPTIQAFTPNSDLDFQSNGTGDITYDGDKISRMTQSATHALSGVSPSFSGVPSWATKITIILHDVGHSTVGGDDLWMRLGDSAIETSGYQGMCSDYLGFNGTTSAYLLTRNNQFINGRNFSGNLILTRPDPTANTWILSGNTYDYGTSLFFVGGDKTTSSAMTNIGFQSSTGFTFTAGTVTFLYEG